MPNHQRRFAALWSLLFALAGLAYAAPQTYTPTCSEIVKMGLDRYIDEFGKRTGDYSTAGQNQAYTRYSDCKRAANDRAALQLPSARRQRLTQTRRELQNLEEAVWALAQLKAGGGTMYSLFASAGYATREDFAAQMIESMRKARRSPRARSRANSDFTRAWHELAKWKQPPAADTISAYSKAETRRLHTKWFQQAQQALGKLQTRSANLPDETAADLANHITTHIRNAAETG